jgi:hypothetical protein
MTTSFSGRGCRALLAGVTVLAAAGWISAHPSRTHTAKSRGIVAVTFSSSRKPRKPAVNNSGQLSALVQTQSLSKYFSIYLAFFPTEQIYVFQSKKNLAVIVPLTSKENVVTYLDVINASCRVRGSQVEK